MNLSSKHKYKYMSMLSLCVYYNLNYDLNTFSDYSYLVVTRALWLQDTLFHSKQWTSTKTDLHDLQTGFHSIDFCRLRRLVRNTNYLHLPFSFLSNTKPWNSLIKNDKTKSLDHDKFNFETRLAAGKVLLLWVALTVYHYSSFQIFQIAFDKIF